MFRFFTKDLQTCYGWLYLVEKRKYRCICWLLGTAY